MRKHLELCLSKRKMEPFPSVRPRRSGKSRIDSIAFVGYQMMVVQWYAVMFAKNGSIRVVSPTNLLERKSVPSACIVKPL